MGTLQKMEEKKNGSMEFVSFVLKWKNDQVERSRVVLSMKEISCEGNNRTSCWLSPFKEILKKEWFLTIKRHLTLCSFLLEIIV